MSEGVIKGLRETFTALDSNGDGLLTLEELKAGLDNAGVSNLPSEKSLRDIMGGIDFFDKDGTDINYTDFLAATLDREYYLSNDACRTAFGIFDEDGDGKIT